MFISRLTYTHQILFPASIDQHHDSRLTQTLVSCFSTREILNEASVEDVPETRFLYILSEGAGRGARGKEPVPPAQPSALSDVIKHVYMFGLFYYCL